MIKLVRNCRIGNVELFSNQGKAIISQTITCKVHKVKDLNIENDNYIYPIDHSVSTILGILETKSVTASIYEYDHTRKKWCCDWGNECDKEFNILILYCFNEDLTDIPRVYHFPMDIVIKSEGITILGDDYYHWYNKYRVDEGIYKDALYSLTIDDFPQFDRKKLKAWLNKLKK